MKIRKILISLISVFSLTSFSVSAAATNSSSKNSPKTYVVKKEKNSSSKNSFENLLNNSLSKIKELFKNHYSSFKNKTLKNYVKKNFIEGKKELKDLNEKDLKEFLKILKNILNEIKKDNENFAKIEGKSKYKNVFKETLKEIVKLIKTNKKFSQKLKNKINTAKKMYTDENVKKYLEIYSTYIENIEKNVISENYINEIIENLNIKITDIISLFVTILNGVINYCENNLNNSEFKNKVKEMVKNVNIKDFYNLFN